MSPCGHITKSDTLEKRYQVDKNHGGKIHNFDLKHNWLLENVKSDL